MTVNKYDSHSQGRVAHHILKKKILNKSCPMDWSGMPFVCVQRIKRSTAKLQVPERFRWKIGLRMFLYDVIAWWPDPLIFFAQSCTRDAPYAIPIGTRSTQRLGRHFRRTRMGVHHPLHWREFKQTCREAFPRAKNISQINLIRMSRKLTSVAPKVSSMLKLTGSGTCKKQTCNEIKRLLRRWNVRCYHPTQGLL